MIKVLNSLAIYLFSTLFIKSISILTIPLFTRILSLHEYGILSIYQTWVNIFAVFVGLQLSGSIASARIHYKPNEFKSYIKSILGLSSITFIIIAVISFALLDQLSNILQIENTLVPLLLIQSFSVYISIFYLTYCIQNKKPKSHLIYSVSIASFSILLSIVMVILLEENKYYGKIYGFMIVNIIGLIFVYYELYYKIKSRIRLKDWMFALPISIPLIIHLLSNLVIGQSNRILITKYIGYEEAAIFSVAYMIGSFSLMIAEATNNVWSPWYLDNTKNNNTQLIKNVSKQYVIAITVIFAFIILMSREILAIMAPATYSTGGSSIVIITVGIFFQYLYRFPLGYEIYTRNMKWIALATIISALLNYYLNVFLIQDYHILGAAFSTLVSYIVLFLAHEIIARKIIKGYNISFYTYLPSIITIALIATLSIYSQEYLFIRATIFAILLVSTLYLMKKGYYEIKPKLSR